VEQNEFEMTWRMAKVAGAIDTTVKLLETVIQTRPTCTFHTAAGNEMAILDLAGLARSVQAATSIRQGVELDKGTVASLEKRVAAIEADAGSMIAELAAGLYP
jgi:hypothetical protein